MLSKAKIKFIRSLSQKKERYEQGLFIAEGNKLAVSGDDYEINGSDLAVLRKTLLK